MVVASLRVEEERVPTTRRLVPEVEALRTEDVRLELPPLMTEGRRPPPDAPPRTLYDRRAV